MNRTTFAHVTLLGLCMLLSVTNVVAQVSSRKETPIGYRFDFGGGKIPTGFTNVPSSCSYSEDVGYGFEDTSTLSRNNSMGRSSLTDGFVTSSQPFFFSVALPEGNYNVKVTLGDDEGSSDCSIRAECRRMMVNRVQTKKGKHTTVEFTVHIRDSLIRNTDKKVNLKLRERSYWHWDNKLTLEFAGASPKVNAIEITSASADVITVFLAGNSTVVDQASEPYAAWGQMIPSFFKPGKVAIANYAESGESLSGFIARRRFEKMLSLMKPGDYAFVEFGHNDQKQKGEGIGAFTSFKKDLEYFISAVKKKGATPVIVTSLQRRKFDSNGCIEETLGDYPDAGRQTARQENVPLIDLNAMSKIMYEAWGPEESIKAFVHFPANTFAGQLHALEDNTHFRPFGAYEVAKLVVKGIRDAQLNLAGYILEDVPEIDPTHPGSWQDFYWPLSAHGTTSEKPAGN